MTIRRTPFRAALVTVLAATTFAACSDSLEESTAEACESWGAYSEAVNEVVATLTSQDSTVGELQDARAAAEEAYGDMEDAAADVAGYRLNDLQTAWDELGSAVDDVESDDTLAEAGASLGEHAAAVREAADGLGAELDCS